LYIISDLNLSYIDLDGEKVVQHLFEEMNVHLIRNKASNISVFILFLALVLTVFIMEKTLSTTALLDGKERALRTNSANSLKA